MMVLDKIESTLLQIKKKKPLILCLTNFVTMDFMANSLLALGASPVMSCDEREIEELVKIAQAVNLNIGTLDSQFIERCKKAADAAKSYRKALILDPVGAGASSLRTSTSRNLLPFADIVRGNASEIMSLLSDDYTTLGVDSTEHVKNAEKIATRLASTFNSTVVVSGEIDFIADDTRQTSLTVGSNLMPLITGMGCTLTAIISAFRAVVSDSYEASVMATTYFGLCGNLAALKTKTPGTFRAIFIDTLYAPHFKSMREFCDEKFS